MCSHCEHNIGFALPTRLMSGIFWAFQVGRAHKVTDPVALWAGLVSRVTYPESSDQVCGADIIMPVARLLFERFILILDLTKTDNLFTSTEGNHMSN